MKFKIIVPPSNGLGRPVDPAQEGRGQMIAGLLPKEGHEIVFASGPELYHSGNWNLGELPALPVRRALADTLLRSQEVGEVLVVVGYDAEQGMIPPGAYYPRWEGGNNYRIVRQVEEELKF